jgi:hypothetical protein
MPGLDDAVGADAIRSLSALVHTLTVQAGPTLGVDVQACSTAVVRGVDRWLAAASVAAARCDGVQDRHRQGPRYELRRTGAPVVVPDLGTERRWPVWSHACRVQGFRSAAFVAGTRRGVTVHLALHAREPITWDDDLLDRAAGLAEGVASVVVVRDEMVALAEAVDDLLDGVRTDGVVDEAVRLVMDLRGCDALEARAFLSSVSPARGS